MIETLGFQAAMGFTGLFLSFVFLAIGAIQSLEPEEPPTPKKPPSTGKFVEPIAITIK